MNREKNSCTEMYLIHGLLNDDIKIVLKYIYFIGKSIYM